MFSIHNAGISYHPLRFFLDTPYRLSFLHFKACFSQETHTPRSLCHRVSHFCSGLLHIIPLINSIAAITEHILTKQHKTAEKVSLLEIIAQSQNKVRDEIEGTPFFPLIATSSDDEITPLAQAILDDDLKKLKEILDCPQFDKKFVNYIKKNGLWFSPLCYAVKYQKQAIFTLLLNSKKIDLSNRNHPLCLEKPIDLAFQLYLEKKESAAIYLLPLLQQQGAPLPSEENIEKILLLDASDVVVKKLQEFIDNFQEPRTELFEYETENIREALKGGAPINLALGWLCLKRLTTEEDLIVEILENYNGNPFFPLARFTTFDVLKTSLLPDDHKIMKTIHAKYPNEAVLREPCALLATLWEAPILRDATPANTGSNFSKAAYCHLLSCVKGISEEDFKLLDFFLEKEEWDEIKNAMDFAYQLILSKESPNALAEAILSRSQETPTLIPVEAGTHGSCYILHKEYFLKCNLGISPSGASHSRLYSHKPGISISQVNRENLKAKKENFGKVLAGRLDTDSSLADRFLHHTDQNAVEMLFIEMEWQTHGNCSWSSSAFLGFKAFTELFRLKQKKLDIKKFQFSKIHKRFFIRFNNYARLQALEIYLTSLQKNIQNFTTRIDSRPLEIVAKKIIALLVFSKADKKDPFLERALDRILKSGFKINPFHSMSDIQKHLPRDMQQIDKKKFEKKCADYILNRYNVSTEELTKVLFAKSARQLPLPSCW